MSKLTMLLFILVAFAGSISHAYLLPRDSTQTCSDLHAQSNNGDRKMAIAIDSSDSMLYSDPTDLRLAAGKSIVDWLVSKSEATSTKKQDLVTVIDFSESANLDYPLGDPENAKSALDSIASKGGTFIASGVEMAIKQLTADGTGATADRSGIVVFTDGVDSSVSMLVDQINNASSAGIRVSFGFLTSSSSLQDKDVLGAIMKSGGRYFTITTAESSNNFINGILINGLTKNDNPNGDSNTLLAGLEASHYISGSETQTMTYTARAKEQLTFTLQSIDAGSLDVQVVSGSRTLATEKSILYSTTLDVVSPGNGNIGVKITANSAPKDSIFVVGVESNLPPQNCTLAVDGGDSGTNKAAIIGPTVGIGLALILGGALYLLWKYCYPKKPKTHTPDTHELQHAPDEKPIPQVTTAALPPPPKSTNWFKEMLKFPDHAPPAVPRPPQYPTTPNDKSQSPNQDGDLNSEDYESGTEWEDVLDQDGGPSEDPSQTPQDPAHKKKKYHRVHRIRIYGNNHHHHLPPNHPCYYDECLLVLPDHVCDDPVHPCTCVDPKCKLNSRRHICKEEKVPPHKCLGPKEDPHCPLNDPPYAESKKKEHAELVRKYMAQDMAKSGVKMGATYAVRGLVTGL